MLEAYVKSRHSDRTFVCEIDDSQPADRLGPRAPGHNPTSPLAQRYSVVRAQDKETRMFKFLLMRCRQIRQVSRYLHPLETAVDLNIEKYR